MYVWRLCCVLVYRSAHPPPCAPDVVSAPAFQAPSVLVVGASFIGMEAAAFISMCGVKSVTVVGRERVCVCAWVHVGWWRIWHDCWCGLRMCVVTGAVRTQAGYHSGPIPASYGDGSRYRVRYGVCRHGVQRHGCTAVQ